MVLAGSSITTSTEGLWSIQKKNLISRFVAQNFHAGQTFNLIPKSVYYDPSCNYVLACNWSNQNLRTMKGEGGKVPWTSTHQASEDF